MAIQRICAWCHCSLGALPAGPVTEVSHGICAECRDHFFDESDGVRSLEAFLDLVDAPVLVVDADGSVLTANRQARELVGKGLGEVRGFPGGEVMECAYARLPGGCGRTDHCNGCTIRNTVMATHQDGVSRRGVEASQDFAGPDGVQRTRILISTEKSGDVVLLRIDGMQPELQAGAG